MLTTLASVKSRLQILDTDTTYDALLTTAIRAVSARFDKETNRTLARTENATYEFDSADTELSPPCYPIESIAKFETKSSESAGWVEQTNIDYIIRAGCVISLASPFRTPHSAFCISRLTYTGGYLLPGSPPPDPPVAVCQDLPDDLEQVAVEQIAFWFQRRDKLGLKISWPSGATYQQFIVQDLLPGVQATLKQYQRFTI